MSLQSYALFPHMTAAENVAFGLEMQGVARAERESRVKGDVGAGRPRRLRRSLSPAPVGRPAAARLARALVIQPRILLLDEPLSNLDAKLREDMQIELRQIQRTLGTTTILVTHDQSEAMALSDRIAVMNQGRVEQIARPHEAYERPATPFVASFLGRTNVLPARRNGNGHWALAAGEAPATITIRPEKIAFAPAGQADALPGTVKTRIFQGNHWLYQIDTPAGLVIVIRQNTGEAVPAEGEAVRLFWRVEDTVLQAADGGRA
jgi:putative spermidine/putrescine transport system ATP-binding protein